MENDILDIIRRSGIVEGKPERALDKFEHRIVNIALRLVDENDDMDQPTASMYILDAVNDKMMTESWERRSGIWYDPYKRALAILREHMDEDAFQDMQARMATQADEYLKSRDSSLSMATHEPGVTSKPEQSKNQSYLGKAVGELEAIRQLAIRDNYTIDRDGINKLGEIIAVLKQADTAGMGNSMRGRERDLPAVSEPDPLYSRASQAWHDRRAERKALRAGNKSQDVGKSSRVGKPKRGGKRKRVGYARSIESIDEEIEEIRRRSGITESENNILATVIPEIRGIAINFVNDLNAKQRMMEIAKELGTLAAST
jgi:hypothetical protein